MRTIRRFLPDMLAVVTFVIIAFVYFSAPVTQGKVLTGEDHSGAVGAGVEMEQYRKTHDGERTRWTNSLFSGMPTYQMAPSYDSSDTLAQIKKAYSLWLPNVMTYVFMMLLGYYILLRAFDFKVWMAGLGAILWAFSSYFFIIIAAGHIWKLLTLCFIPPTLAGMVLCYRGKYLGGIVVTGIFMGLQILSNHIQMTYYFLFVIGLMALAYLIEAIRQQRKSQAGATSTQRPLAGWFKSSACFALGIALGVLANLSNLYHTWEYSKESMRSKTELTAKTKNAADQTNSGLERSYITQWSYGGDELLTLMVPNAKGGASVPLSQNKIAIKEADPTLATLQIGESYGGYPVYAYDGFTQYFGAQPMTSGPVYVGAFVCFLFFLGLFIVRGPMKWCLLAATILSILLSLGHNLMWFTDLFLDYVPMYDKFRTVASILVIAEFTIPLLGLLALKQLIDEPQALHSERVTRGLYISLGLTAGVCLIMWAFPSLMGDYATQEEISSLSSNGELGKQLLASISKMRQAMFTADCMRSLLIILVGFATLLAYRKGFLKPVYMGSILIVLCLVDMWSVNKRYLNDDNFVMPRSAQAQIPMTPADEMILQDTDKDYRVLDLTKSTFNSNDASCYHKSIGGYHAAKLRRYQELIETHISQEMMRLQQAVSTHNGDLTQVNGDSLMPVLNMLNMKYMLFPAKEGAVPVPNPHANGNAWFVNRLTYVADADSELEQLGRLNTRHEAVADKKFQSVLGEATQDSTATVRLVGYEANELTYEVQSLQGGVVAFSEIYYPGWTATVDGKEAAIGRVNYVLRAMRLAPGQHRVVLKFDPQSVHTTELIAYIALGLLGLLFVLFLVQTYRKKVQG